MNERESILSDMHTKPEESAHAAGHQVGMSTHG